MRRQCKFKPKNIELRRVLGSESIVSTTLTIEQCRGLLAEMENDPLRTMFIAAVCLGLRAGELRALKWGDFSDDDRASAGMEFRFDHAVGQLRIVNLKEAACLRLPLSPELAAVLRNWRSKSSLKSDSDWVFASPHHKGAVSSSRVLLMLRIRLAARSAGLTRQVSWYKLRCTYARLLSDLGLSRQAVAAFMRHEFTEFSGQVFVAAQRMIARMLLSKERREDQPLSRQGKFEKNKPAASSN